MIEIREIPALAAPENGAIANCETTIRTDREAGGEKSVRLKYVVELKLLVGNNFTLSIVLIGENAIFQNHDRSVDAFLPLFKSHLALA